MTKELSKFSDKIYYYQSANNDAKSIKENFVVRIAEFQQIINALLNKKKNDPLQHELILGRRGSGKSTLLKRIEIEITENKKLSEKYIAINFAEEQSSIYRLFDLWSIVIEELNSRFDENIATRRYTEFGNDEEYTMYLYSLIRKSLQKKNKRLVLLLDNFDRVVESFHDDGNLLRETLINYNDIQIIGGSTRMNEHFWQYELPFYEFFRRHHLEALSSHEMRKLILHWSETLKYEKLKDFAKDNLGKIESIRILTDGLPRTLQFFIEILLDNSELYGYDYLKKIMDKVTPVYQERLNTLTPQLRKIVAEMAFLWEACSTKQLVEKCKMKSALISANLKTLIDKGLVTKIETGKKNHLYRISERFFNMWFMVTQGNPTQKRKAKWLSVFLEYWYNKEEFKNLVDQHIENLQSGNVSHNKLILASKGLSQCRYVSVKQRDHILELSKSIQENARENLIPLPEKFMDVAIKIEKLEEEEKYEEAIKLTKNIENEEGGDKFFILGYLYLKQKKEKEAETHYLKALKLGHSRAGNNLANLYGKQERFKEAEIYYLQAVELGHSRAMNNLALLYEKQAKIREAEKYYKQAVDLEYVESMFNLANLYREQEKFKEAEKYYKQAVGLEHVESMFNLANLYRNKKKFKEAEAYYLQASESGYLDAIYNLANLYREQEKFKEAEVYYLRAVELRDSEAMNNLALLYEEQGKFKEAEVYYLKAVELKDSGAMFNLALLYEEQDKFKEAEIYYLQAVELGYLGAMNNLALLYVEQERFKEAERYYLQAIKLGHSGAMSNLALLYISQDKFKKAERYYLQAIELGHARARYNLALLYFTVKLNKKKALNTIQVIPDGEPKTSMMLVLKIIIEIWNGIFNRVEERILEVLEKFGTTDFYLMIKYLLVHQQNQMANKLFNHPKFGEELKDRFLVLYYATLKLDNKEDKQLLSVPPELQGTLNDVLEEIEGLQKWYGYENS
jgi:TPR repeat protein/energy-coupling factor transporter ATP-binding protein EcfA2